MGVLCPVHTLDSSVWLRVCTVPQTLWVYGGVRPYIVSKSISRHLRVVIVEVSHLAAGRHISKKGKSLMT